MRILIWAADWRVQSDVVANSRLQGLVYRGGSAYSDMALLPNGSIGVAWERGRYQWISFAVLTPPWATAP